MISQFLNMNFTLQMLLVISTLILGSVGLLIFKILYNFLLPRKHSIPERYPLESTIKTMNNQHRVLDYINDLFIQAKSLYNTNTFLSKIIGQPTYIITNNPINIEHVLNKLDIYGKTGPGLKPKFQALLGNGIFNADGIQWHAHRKITSHLFKFEQFKHIFMKSFNINLDLVIDNIYEYEREDKVFDMQVLMQSYTLETIAHIILGHKLGTS